jgi:hypothetical protein
MSLIVNEKLENIGIGKRKNIFERLHPANIFIRCKSDKEEY